MKQLVLLGGGHAHLAVLADLATRALHGWQVTLVTPYRRQIYSGMLPGWVAGHYHLDRCAIALDALALRAGVHLHTTACTALDLQAQAVLCADGTRLPFDRLSIDTGPVAAMQELPGAAEHALCVRPIEGFVAAWPALAARIATHTETHTETRTGGFHLVVLGTGAGGIELALAMHHRASAAGWPPLRITLVGSDTTPLAGFADGVRRRVVRELHVRGIAWRGGQRACAVEPGRLVFAQGAPLAFDGCLLATGAAAPEWPRAAGLATDARGFIRVTRTLQSVSHGKVLAAGDVAAYADARPKSGVFAVRAGPVLARNLRALCEGRAPREWTPQARALYLLALGGQRATAVWGPFSWTGDWVWRWKDHIDQRFVARHGSDETRAPPGLRHSR